MWNRHYQAEVGACKQKSVEEKEGLDFNRGDDVRTSSKLARCDGVRAPSDGREPTDRPGVTLPTDFDQSCRDLKLSSIPDDEIARRPDAPSTTRAARAAMLFGA